jgi:hypothetical protein
MSNFPFKGNYVSKVGRELAQAKIDKCSLTPFKAQAVVFDILKNHLITNQPADLGYPFEETYSPDETKSKIFIDLSNNWNPRTPHKRPAVFVYRGTAEYGKSGTNTIGHNRIGANVAESEESFARICSLPIMLNCIQGPVGAAETFADYIKYPFLYFSKRIMEEYCFIKFKLSSISTPEHYLVDGKDVFSVKLNIDTEFFDTWQLKGDHLKLKSVHNSVYTELNEKPLENQ